MRSIHKAKLASKATALADAFVVRIGLDVDVVHIAGDIESARLHTRTHQSNISVHAISAAVTRLFLTPGLLRTDLVSSIRHQIDPFLERVQASRHAEDLSHRPIEALDAVVSRHQTFHPTREYVCLGGRYTSKPGLKNGGKHWWIG